MTRYFKGTGTVSGSTWKWDGNQMWIAVDRYPNAWEESVMSVEDLQTAVDTVETDEDGNEMTFESTLTKQDHADKAGPR